MLRVRTAGSFSFLLFSDLEATSTRRPMAWEWCCLSRAWRTAPESLISGGDAGVGEAYDDM